MIKLFTQNDLIKFLYHETSEEESKEISKALDYDSELRALYDELKTVTGKLDEATAEPSNAAILNILSYSRNLQEKQV